jgi:hypothetical protein
LFAIPQGSAFVFLLLLLPFFARHSERSEEPTHLPLPLPVLFRTTQNSRHPERSAAKSKDPETFNATNTAQTISTRNPAAFTIAHHSGEARISVFRLCRCSCL